MMPNKDAFMRYSMGRKKKTKMIYLYYIMNGAVTATATSRLRVSFQVMIVFTHQCTALCGTAFETCTYKAWSHALGINYNAYTCM